MPKGSDLFVAALENEGVDRIFGVPGEENLDIVESLRTFALPRWGLVRSILRPVRPMHISARCR